MLRVTLSFVPRDSYDHWAIGKARRQGHHGYSHKMGRDPKTWGWDASTPVKGSPVAASSREGHSLISELYLPAGN
jgi:hypothetical protein